MANIRVYELARDLNMKNKALLEKLSKMDVAVRSHMSSLDDDVVNKIKANLLGKNAVEETRVRTTVIRRRRKPANKKTGWEEKKRQFTDEKTKTLSSDEAKGNDKRISESTAPPSEIHPKPAKKDHPPPEHKSDREISSGYDPKKQEDIASLKPKGQKPPEASVGKHADKESDKKNHMPVKGNEKKFSFSKKKHPYKKTAETAKSVTAPKQTANRDAKSKSDHSSDVKTAKKKRKRRKRTRKDFPAKIIKLPTPTEALPETEAKENNLPGIGDENAVSTNARPHHQRPGIKETPKPVLDKKKKKKKDVEENKDTRTPGGDKGDKKVKEIRWTKKKISFKRKEVVEGDALYSGNRRGKKSRKPVKNRAVQSQKPNITIPKAIKRRIKIDETIVLSDLAKRMGIKANEIIGKLLTMGVMVTVNQTIDFDTAVLVAAEFNYELEKASFEEEDFFKTEDDDPEKMTERPPVVTIMGHVDHGKTSLLDVIRKTRITENEAGGITQHIGAYNVPTERGQVIFLDTPGHEAFTAMRARGAMVTDLVVLVVAADDGVMPQTVEAINHSKAAGVPIIVAVNKIDKANANIDRVYRELSEQGLVPEDWGGDTIFVKVSAKQNIGLDNLLEMILLQAEVLELKANSDKLAMGYVVEAKLDSGRGPVATVLIKEGTLRAGDSVVCGIHHGKIRAMLNDRWQQIEEAGPSIPVEILGLSGVPNAGDEMFVLADEKSAKQVSSHRVQKQRAIELAKTSRLSLEKLFEKMQKGEVKDLNLIIKADVNGSIEALRDSLLKLSNEEVAIHAIHAATGTITESDVSLAAVSNAIIIGFNVRPSPKVQAFANEEHVDMRFYNIIYNVIKDIQDAIVGMMKSTYEERVLGRAEVREVFHVPKIGAIAGCYITDGKIERNSLMRLLREGVVCFEGKIGSLRRFKDDVKEVQSGYECGIGVENYNDIKTGDVIECYYLEEIKPVLTSEK